MRGTLVRPNSSNLSSSSNKAGRETVSILRRPHSAGAVLGHIDAGSCGTHEDMGRRRDAIPGSKVITMVTVKVWCW